MCQMLIIYMITSFTDTKSESDIEVLSTDSSSIEVLGKHCPDSESEVE